MVSPPALHSVLRWLGSNLSVAVREPTPLDRPSVCDGRSLLGSADASHGALDEAFEDWRIEVKATMEEHQMDRLDAWIAAHPLRFGQPYPDRWVNNVYFDTPALGAYEENLAGLSRRRKLRLRWYGDERLPASAVFEVKLRRNSLGAKQRVSVSLDEPDSVSWRDLREQLRAQIYGRAAADFASMSEPIILNRYRRTYYEAEQEDVRLTIDRDVRFIDQRLSAYPRYAPAHPLEGYVVFEAKVSAARDPRRLLRNLPMRLSRNSKYAIGVRTVLGGT